MKNFKKILIVFVLLLVGFFIFYEAASASIFGGLDTAGEAAGFSEDTNIYSRISMIISVALGFVGVVFLGLTLYGGFIWMIARGNEQEIEKAKKLIEAAVIGLAIVFAAYAITYFVTERILSTTSGGGGGFTCAEGEVSCSCSGDSYPESLCAPRTEDCVCTPL
ncbi:pilin [Patescibacteria group bacterium]|nr:pilin [Patescibacteria group bacterium]